MSMNRLFLTGLMGITVTSSGFAGIIDDKSQFAGDYTVIDFETRGDGTPLILEQGEAVFIDPGEYSDYGVTITASGIPPWYTGDPLIANDGSLTFDAAQAIIGSPTNCINDISGTGSLRFDFATPVNALGMAIVTQPDARVVSLEAYDIAGSLLDSVEFAGSLVDGTIRGDEFGELFNADYGFMGLFVENDEIAYAVLTEGGTQCDDLHFGIVPEPGTLLLLGAATLLVGVRHRRGRRVVDVDVPHRVVRPTSRTSRF